MESLPKTVWGVTFAQTVGRNILLGCHSGIHLHDTISGDWSRIGDCPDPESATDSSSVVGTCITANTLLCLNAKPVVTQEDKVLQTSIVTLNDSLLYPSTEMGWGRLLEWDTEKMATLGLVRESQT
ncbi:hypothetical protein KIPB_008096 [Kipferlia bialata]|uniref:Uncharacterized protein n=1 Tax=Kipferlia bialata TaxID=797122 RepID=A0A391NQR0_9EUKA|nr:hypothetical protein KIPB_008096 [Kipferlia bialata]|eukprot:g8096.t1